MACPRCRTRGKTWEGSDPVCGFDENGAFVSQNWNCATLNKLRDLACDLNKSQRYGNISFAYLPHEDIEGCERFLVMSWYKSRGRLGQLWIFCEDDPPIAANLADAEKCLAQKDK